MGLYLYCFIEPVEAVFPVGAIANPDGEVYSLREGNVAPVVSESLLHQYDPIRRHLLAHQRVLAVVRECGWTALPMTFGTVVDDETQLRNFARDHADELGRLLEELAGCVEVAVKVLWDPNKALQEIAGRLPDVARERESLVNRGVPVLMERRVEIGKRLEEGLHERRRTFAREMITFMSVAARRTKVDEPLDDSVVLNAAFLVGKDEQPAFERRVEQLDALYQGRFTIRYTGPLAPHNFVQLRPSA